MQHTLKYAVTVDVLFLLCLLYLIISGVFGYLFAVPKNLSEFEYTQASVYGEYVKVPVSSVIGTYARYGLSEEAASGTEDYTLRFVAVEFRGGLLGIRLNRSQQKLLEMLDNPQFIGTIRKAEPQSLALLREWASENYYSGQDAVYVGKRTPDMVIYVDYYGDFHKYAIFAMYAFILLAGGFAIALTMYSIISLCRTDKTSLETAVQISEHLLISDKYIWILLPFAVRQLERSKVERALVRAKRLEGGKMRYYYVAVFNGKEYKATVPADADLGKYLISQLRQDS